jgi:hypothetical protein
MNTFYLQFNMSDVFSDMFGGISEDALFCLLDMEDALTSSKILQDFDDRFLRASLFAAVRKGYTRLLDFFWARWRTFVKDYRSSLYRRACWSNCGSSFLWLRYIAKTDLLALSAEPHVDQSELTSCRHDLDMWALQLGFKSHHVPHMTSETWLACYLTSTECPSFLSRKRQIGFADSRPTKRIDRGT